MGDHDVVRATYRLRSAPGAVEERVRALVLEQSVELPDAAVRDPALRAAVLGRPESIERTGDAVHDVTVAWPDALFDGTAANLLNVLFGNSALHDDVTLVDVDVPPAVRDALGGPRHGIEGLRAACGATGRPLTCTALKPVGLGASDLAALARTFALAGVDVVKDDHGLANQASAPFPDRVRACVAAVREAADAGGHRALYCPNVLGSPDEVRRGIETARALGADAVMLEPAVLGLPAFSDIVRDDPGLPVLAHPALASVHGIEPAALLGRLFRLFGADAVIFPSYGGRFAWSDRTCARLAAALRDPWEPLRPALPTPAGGMALDRVEELLRFYGRDVMLLVGGSLYLAGDDLAERTREFVEAVRNA